MTEIIELLQSDSNTLSQSEYTVEVPPGTIINRGDMLSMEKCFLDTQAVGSQKIVIAEDLEVDAGVGYYIQSVRTDKMDVSGGGAVGYVDPARDDYVDTKTYVLVEETPGGGFILPGIRYDDSQTNDSWAPNLEESTKMDIDFFGMDLTVQYTNPAGVVKQQVLHLQDYDWLYVGSGDRDSWQSVAIESVQYDKAKPVTFLNCVFNGQKRDPDQPNIRVTNQAVDLHNNNEQLEMNFHVNKARYQGYYSFNPDPAGSTLPAGGKSRPYTRDTQIDGYTITLPKGNYTEADLAGVLNDGFQRDYSTTAKPLGSTFLLPYNLVTYPNTAWVESEYLAAYDTTAGDLADIGGGILVGATQMELSYDPDRAKFLWKYIHSPFLFGPSGATEAVGFIPTANLVTDTAKPKVVARNSGVYFTSLRARVASTQQPFDLWEGLLGFDLSKILVAMTPPADKTIGTRVFTDLQMPVSLEAGTFTTENYPSLAMLADPRDPGTNWWYMPDLTTTYMTTANDQTVPIFASSQDSAQNENNEGYYLISVATKARGTYVGGDGFSSGSIIGIVGGFYSKDSYTAGTAGDAIGYVHQGETINLDSFKVRLLGPDKAPSRVLGGRNMVALRITRASGGAGV